MFKSNASSPGTNRIDTNRSSGNRPHMSIQQVPVVSLDFYCEQLGIGRIDFLKIDVEGMEPFVLKGAKRLLCNRLVHSILIEICPANLSEAGFSASGLYDQILRLGYRPFSLAKNGLVGEPMSCAELSAITLGNVVLLPS
jgi:hypothetical protein